MTPARARVVIAPDKFKGSLTATQVADHIATSLRHVRPDIDLVAQPIADGGEGTLDAALAAGYKPVPVTVTGPDGRLVNSRFAMLGQEAVIEMALASGLALLANRALDPLRATSRGVGELILAALDHNAKRIVLGVGGSASTDGSAGMIQALGGRLLNANGADLPDGGAALRDLVKLDLDNLDPRLAAIEVVLASDVDNPLLGPDGAAAVYGPQKGATTDHIDLLEQGLIRWSTLVTPQDAQMPGAGAAGGLGYASLAILHAQRQSGAEMVLQITNLHAQLAHTQLIITGEGRLDRQTLRGKGPAAVAAAGHHHGIPVIAVCGQRHLDDRELVHLGIRATYATTDLQPDCQLSMRDAGPLLTQLAEGIARTWLN